MNYIKSLLLIPAVVSAMYLPNPEQKLRSASEIVVSEKALSWGKSYSVLIDNEEIATVTGKDFVWWEDVFVLKTKDNNILASEKENKRFLSYDRSASIYDGAGKLKGHFAEKYWQDFFNWNHVFHIFDASQKEIGKTQTTTFSIMDKIDVYDAQGNVDYRINENLSIFADKYTITVFDKKSTIPLEQVILLTCIEDVIKDAAANDD